MKASLVRFSEGDIIFKSGDTSRNMYIIRSGTVKVVIEKDGRQIPITELGKGQYIGEMSFLTGIKRSATVTAATPVLVSEIPSTILEDEHLGISSWAVAIAKVLVRRIRTTTEQLGEYMSGEKTPEMTESQAAAEIGAEKDQQKPEQDRRLFLKGRFSESSIETVKNKIREIKVKQGSSLILDFSDVIDIDQAGINYIFTLVKSSEVADRQIRIENMQLIRDKVLSIKGLQNILNRTHIPIRHVEKDELLIRQGDLEHVMYVVKNGTFTISSETETGTIILGKAESGDVIGEMALIKQGIRSADVRADKPGTVHVLDVRDFYNNVYNVPGWFLELIRSLVQRLRDTNELIMRFKRGEDLTKADDEWNKPFGIILDSTKPGRYSLSGSMTLPNLQYFIEILKLEIFRKRREVYIDLSRITRMDEAGRRALYQFSKRMESQGIRVTITEP